MTAPVPCGCQVDLLTSYDATTQTSLTTGEGIRFCALHQSAAQMQEALEISLETFKQLAEAKIAYVANVPETIQAALQASRGEPKEEQA